MIVLGTFVLVALLLNKSESDGFAEVDVLDAAKAVATADAYAKWGKGAHPAGLNFGDCFAYVSAKANNLPLLFIGDDFARTDVLSAL